MMAYKSRTFITRTLSDILPTRTDFENEIINELNFAMEEGEADYLFTLLYSKYGDSHVRYTNEDLFILNLRKEIMINYPTVIAFLRDQKKMRDTSDEEFAKGGKMVMNMGSHNTANVSTDTMDGIEQLDAQQINNSQRAKIDVLLQRMEAYRSDIEDRFLNKFVKYFAQIIYPQRDLLYWEEPGEVTE